MSGKRLTARAFLGREIRRAREKAGLSRETLGRGLYVSGSLVAKWESGRQVPSADQLNALIDRLSFGPDVLRHILTDLVANEIPPTLTDWREIENEATEIASFDLSAVPGLLQTEDYARAILNLSSCWAIDIEEQLRVRMERQSILERDDPPVMIFVLDEFVLMKGVGDSQIMAAQVEKLIEMTRRPGVYLHIVPSDEAYYVGSSFMLAKMNHKEVALLDNALHANIVQDPHDVASVSRIWQGIRAVALPTSESIAKMEKAVKLWQ